MKRRYGNCVESISKQKLYKQGYSRFASYWSDNINQQNMIQNLVRDMEYVYTQKRDKTGLFHIVVYVKIDKVA